MKKGFTLLELLIVIGILAILSTTMVLVINPAEMLKKARDSQRISDLNTVKTAIAMYLTDVSSASLTTGSYAYNHSGVTIPAGPCGGVTFSHASTSQAITGIGWIPINFASIAGGSPIGAEPIDPNPATGRYYVAILNGTNSTFELIGNMESIAYSSEGPNDVESKDGGNIIDYYEVGTSMIASTSIGCY
jgi:prepilin-type N-terminal cleavage/methylation domain-containing protein